MKTKNWVKSAKPLKRAPGCTCERVLGGLSTVLASDGAPESVLPAMSCNCGRTLVSLDKTETWHRTY